ncbi:hypothetical protein [Vibrio mediterranei]|uniref:hypothetical protein n=1 Tax=Vibrio mediterranei TaxID=689 RepID=UPI00406778A5
MFFESNNLGNYSPCSMVGWEPEKFSEYDGLEFPEYNREPTYSIINSNFLENIKEWRDRAANHPLLGDEFIGFTELDGRTTAEMIFCLVDRLKELIKDGFLPVVSVSFGKDSSALLTLFMLAYGELKNEGYYCEQKALILHSDTKVETPEVMNLAITQWNLLLDTIWELGLPIEMRLAQPTFSSSFLGRVVTGRGLPTTTSSANRECSDDLKARPLQGVLNEYLREMKRELGSELKPLLMLGSRDEEGTIRAASIAANGGTDDPLAVTYKESTKQYVAYLVKDLRVETIWEILALAGTKLNAVIPSVLDFDQTTKVYADSSGECVALDSDAKAKANSSPCGARHGCFTCLAVSTDKSMEKLLEKEEYAYLKHLARVRTYISKVHNDWDKRCLWSRTPDKYGYLKIQPNLYGFEVCHTILHALLTADALEQERCLDLAEEVYWGRIQETAEVRKMMKPRFRYVTKRDIALIDYYWSFNTFSKNAFQALALWKRVYEDKDYNRLEDVDSMPMAPSRPQPKPMYMYVGKRWDDEGQNLGLRHIEAEMTMMGESHLLETHVRKVDGEQTAHTIMSCETSKTVMFSDEWAEQYIKDGDRYLELYGHVHMASAAAISLLSNGTVSIPKGKELVYQNMMLRYQWHAARRMVGDMKMADFLDAKQTFEEICETPILSSQQYRLKLKELAGSDFDESLVLSGKELNRFNHYQINMFGDDDIVLTEPVKKASVKKATTKNLVQGQLSIFDNS